MLAYEVLIPLLYVGLVGSCYALTEATSFARVFLKINSTKNKTVYLSLIYNKLLPNALNYFNH
jgi:hypothetical protein